LHPRTTIEDEPGRKKWLARLEANPGVSVTCAQEWQQMLREIWRLQKDHFWTEDKCLALTGDKV